MPRLKWVEVRGLRSFGIEQSLIFDEEIALVWGGNSQGKTSVAEAVEFLLSGTVVRPVMLGGAKNQYDRSLRNAYLPDDEPTVVRAGIDDADGNERRVERQLTTATSSTTASILISACKQPDRSSFAVDAFAIVLRPARCHDVRAPARAAGSTQATTSA